MRATQSTPKPGAAKKHFKSMTKKYSGWSYGGAGWLASLLLSHVFLSNMLLRRALPSSRRARNPIAGLFFSQALRLYEKICAVCYVV
jgi:hypothetical protein